MQVNHGATIFWLTRLGQNKMFVVLRVSKPNNDVQERVTVLCTGNEPGCVVDVIGVFATKGDAEKCRRTDMRRVHGMIQCTESDMRSASASCKSFGPIWRICPVPRPGSCPRQFQSGDPVHVLTHEATLVDCAGTQEDIDAVAQQFVLHTQITTRDKLKWHTLRFNMYKPGLFADTCMHVCAHKKSDTDVPNTLKF